MSVMDLFRLDNKVALITGGGSGIGRAYAEAVSEAGAAVACADIDFATAEDTASSLPGKAVAIRADVSEERQVKEMVEKTVSELGKLDIAFANAGVGSSLSAPFPEASLEQWRQIIDVNLTGVWLTAREAARVMIERGEGGKIISTASIYGFVGGFTPSSGAYSAAKGGVINLTRDLASTLAPHNINVTAIAPGFFRTNISGGRLFDTEDEANRKFAEEIERRVPAGVIGEVGDLKGTAVFLASPASNYLTGYTIAVDGGWLSW